MWMSLYDMKIEKFSGLSSIIRVLIMRGDTISLILLKLDMLSDAIRSD